jgi:hypothetical protein
MAMAAACGNVSPDDRLTLLRPSREAFPPVGNFLVARCGSLDCHGQVGRNLRLYGNDGLRLDPKTLVASSVTTEAELDEDYRSVVALEPEAMNEVLAEGGAHASRLTLIQKPRGEQQHKGGILIVAGDAQDRCILSWLASNVDKDACTQALMNP